MSMFSISGSSSSGWSRPSRNSSAWTVAVSARSSSWSCCRAPRSMRRLACSARSCSVREPAGSSLSGAATLVHLLDSRARCRPDGVSAGLRAVEPGGERVHQLPGGSDQVRARELGPCRGPSTTGPAAQHTRRFRVVRQHTQHWSPQAVGGQPVRHGTAVVGRLADQHQAGRAPGFLEGGEPLLQVGDLLDRGAGDEENQVRGLGDSFRGNVRQETTTVRQHVYSKTGQRLWQQCPDAPQCHGLLERLHPEQYRHTAGREPLQMTPEQVRAHLMACVGSQRQQARGRRQSEPCGDRPSEGIALDNGDSSAPYTRQREGCGRHARGSLGTGQCDDAHPPPAGTTATATWPAAARRSTAAAWVRSTTTETCTLSPGAAGSTLKTSAWSTTIEALSCSSGPATGWDVSRGGVRTSCTRAPGESWSAGSGSWAPVRSRPTIASPGAGVTVGASA